MTTTAETRQRRSAILLLCLAAVLNGCTFGLPIDVRPLVDDRPSSMIPDATTGASASTTSVPGIPESPTGHSVYLAALGGFPADLVADLAEFFAAKYDIDVQTLTASTIDPGAIDELRDQYVAEELVGHVMDSYPKSEANQASVVIALVSHDLYILDRPDWSWAFGLRDDRGYAVVSTAHMGSLAEPILPIVKSRLRKMILRDIGVLYFGLSLNQDPLSVLYSDLLGVDDLDRMGGEFCGSDCPGHASADGRVAVARARGERLWIRD